MSFFESIPLAEQQSEICQELAAELKQKLIESGNYGWVSKEYILEDGSFEFQGREFGGEYRWYMFFPFSSMIEKEHDEKSNWVVGLQENENQSYSYDKSSVRIYEVPIDSSGKLNFAARDNKYLIYDDSIISSCMIDRRFKARTIPRLPNGSIDTQAFGAPDAKDLTNLRILLEDALGQLT